MRHRIYKHLDTHAESRAVHTSSADPFSIIYRLAQITCVFPDTGAVNGTRKSGAALHGGRGYFLLLDSFLPRFLSVLPASLCLLSLPQFI